MTRDEALARIEVIKAHVEKTWIARDGMVSWHGQDVLRAAEEATADIKLMGTLVDDDINDRIDLWRNAGGRLQDGLEQEICDIALSLFTEEAGRREGKE